MMIQCEDKGGAPAAEFQAAMLYEMLPVVDKIWGWVAGQTDVLSSIYLAGNAGQLYGLLGDTDAANDAVANDLRGLNLMQLLKKAARKRGGYPGCALTHTDCYSATNLNPSGDSKIERSSLQHVSGISI